MAVIESRRTNASANSYTRTLFQGGTAKIAEKIREESEELIAAADETGDGASAHLVHEAADLVFHLCVLLGYREVGWDAVEAELATRFGISGLDEKASRGSR
jgi:phosphoribosyl-ATP pyrophosphohydrolase